jgi:hypothetical protein
LLIGLHSSRRCRQSASIDRDGTEIERIEPCLIVLEMLK